MLFLTNRSYLWADLLTVSTWCVLVLRRWYGLRRRARRRGVPLICLKTKTKQPFRQGVVGDTWRVLHKARVEPLKRKWVLLWFVVRRTRALIFYPSSYERRGGFFPWHNDAWFILGWASLRAPMLVLRWLFSVHLHREQPSLNKAKSPLHHMDLNTGQVIFVKRLICTDDQDSLWPCTWIK